MRGLLLIAVSALAIVASGDPAPRPARWFERVRSDFEQFHRPIYDRAAAARAGDKPIGRARGAFCPHEDRSRLQAVVLSQSPADADEPMTATAYYCEIEDLYWVHAVGGPNELNLVTGPYRVGAGAPASGPASAPASRPATGALTIALRRGSAVPPVAGAAVPVDLLFTNNSPEPIWINTNLAVAQVSFAARGPKVDAQPHEVPAAVPLKDDFVRIDPKSAHALHLRDLDGGTYRYRLAMPGTYAMRVTYRNEQDGAAFGIAAWTGSATSDPITIEVIGPTPAR